MLVQTLRIMEELCEDYLNELRSLSGQPNEQKLILFCDRLFGQYYGGIQNRLVLEVRRAIGGANDRGPEAISVGLRPRPKS